MECLWLDAWKCDRTIGFRGKVDYSIFEIEIRNAARDHDGTFPKSSFRCSYVLRDKDRLRFRAINSPMMIPLNYWVGICVYVKNRKLFDGRRYIRVVLRPKYPIKILIANNLCD